ncbi:TPA: GBS Bsp-like repeat-containing protein [Streptococcus suis]|nr:GBS Bsp-like repeat-containing protein [Streptococcus suis]
MKKKSLLFLSLCAWTLQSHLVHANTVLEATDQVSQGTETESQSTNSSNTTANSSSTTGTSSTSVDTATKPVVTEVSSESDAAVSSTQSVPSTSTPVPANTTQATATTVAPAVASTTTSTTTSTSTSAAGTTQLRSVQPTTASSQSSSSTTPSTSTATTNATTSAVSARSAVPSTETATTTSTATVSTPNHVAVSNVDSQKGTYDVRVTNVSSAKEIKTVFVPTWSEVNGQDDILWYEAKRQLDGSYKLTVNKAQHKNTTGKYHSHVYYLTKDGALTGIGTTSATLQEPKPTGTVSVANVNTQAGTYDVVIKNVYSPTAIDKVYVPTWTENKGQDDIIWHVASRQVDGSYKYTVKKSEHKNETGNYISHVYYRGKDGKQTYIGATVANLATTNSGSTTSNKLSGTISISNINAENGSFVVKVTNVSSPNGVKSVLVPTWTENKSVDDIVFHEAVRQADGSYEAIIKKSEHKNETGKYITTVYYIGNNGNRTFVGTKTATLPAAQTVSTTPEKASGKITVSNINASAGTYDVVISEVKSPVALDKVLVPTWTSNKGQDDIIWHEASRQSDGSYKYTVKKSEHKNETGNYISHVYYQGKDGKRTYIGATTATVPVAPTPEKASGKITVSNINASAGTYDVVISEVKSPVALDKVLVPTWTSNKGQDDIIWHEASRQSDGSYKYTVKKSEHKNETGNYISHVYYQGKDGKRTYIGATTATVPVAPTPEKASGKITVSNINASAGTYDVVISEVKSPVALDKVLVPTWTSNKGQDDIIWHEASRQSDGSYKYTVKKSEHKNETGNYISHVYYQGKDGKRTYIGATTATVPEAPTQPTTSNKLSGTISVSNVNAEEGSFVVKITNVSSPNGVKSVIVPTWTENKSVDDIVFYEAVRQSDGSYEALVKKSEHKNEIGKYITTVYYQGNDGSRTFVGTTTVTLPASQTVEKTPETASAKVTVANINSNTGMYDVIISEVKSPVTIDKVLVPTWTENKNQDDIIWHEASRQSDGTYKYTVKKFEHNNETGKYISHVYYRGTDGSMTGVGAVTAELQAPATPAKASGTVTITNVNSQIGSFDVVIKDVISPVALDKVLVPTWTDNKDQDDIIWHEATRQSDGSYRLTVLSSQHKNESGNYTSHVYYRGKDGSMAMVGAAHANLPAGTYSQRSPQRSFTVYIDPGHGGADSGASYGGVHEKTLAMNVANKLKANLLALGINVLMTRTADYNVDFVTERSRMANSSNADLFISLHFNATGAGTTRAKGIETYWYQSNPSYPSKINQAYHNDPTRLAESQILANQVQASLIKETGAYNRGVKRETFAVLRETKIPAVLVEMGFMDNPSELQVIKQDSYQTKLAKALAQGIANWYGIVGGK